VLSAALFLVLVTVAVIQGLKRAPYLATGWFWYLGTLIPVIGLIQVGGQPMADRYTYIPLIGLSLMVAWGAADLKARFALNRMVLPTLAIAVTVGCAALARVQVGYWKDTLTLWTHALAVTRGNYYAHGNLGHALLDLGKLDEALAQYGESLRLRPAAADVHGGMAIALDRQGKGAEAIPHYREALRFKPAYAEGHNNLGVALARQGKTDEAVSHYREAVRLRPDYADAHNNLGSAFAKTGNTAEAIREFREALRLKPDPDVYYNLGAMYEASGDLGQARRSYEAALQLAPQNPHARGALDQLNSSGASR
jgi:Flp pilus assembly protein TadD